MSNVLFADVLDALQHNLHTDSLGIDKRLNSNFKVIIVFPANIYIVCYWSMVPNNNQIRIHHH